MVKNMVEFKAYGGRALRIAVGIMTLVLVMAGGAGATIIIKDNATGGDCTSIGTWSAGTKTCTMTTDLNEGIQIDSNGMTLDGNGRTITGNSGFGVYLSGRSGVLIKNLTLEQFSYGVYFAYSNNNYLTGNNVSNNGNGIYLIASNNNTLNSNNASNNGYGSGITLYSSSNNTLSGNIASNNNDIGIKLSGSPNNNVLIGNNANSNTGNGIGLCGASNTLIGNNASNNKNGAGIGISCQGINATLSGNTANYNRYGIQLFGSNMLIDNNANSNTAIGIDLSSSSSNTLIGNNANLNTGYGIVMGYSNTLIGNNANSNTGNGISLFNNNNTLTGNNANSNTGDGIQLVSSNNMLSGNNANSNTDNGISLSSSSDNNVLIGNNANSNNNYGINLDSSSSNMLSGNNASNNYYGIYISSSSNNIIYNNLFINNNNFESSTSVNKWNTTKTPGTNIIGGPYIGGNFWANPGGTGFSQTCPDADGDGVCNSIYTLDSSNIDYLPLSMNFNKDTVSPASITNLTNITYAPTYINFTWTNPTDPDFNHTEVYLNGTFLTNIPAPQNYYNATGLLPDTSYELSTRTVDTSGNINETWVNNTASTLPASGTTLNLYTGWNLISLPLMPDDTSITSILSPVSGNYSIVWEYNASDTTDHWKKYEPGAPFGNDLTSMEPGKGYWIMMTNNDTLPITGTAPESIDRKTGWNLIGYNSLVSQPITDALSSIDGNYSIIWAYNASDTTDYWKKYDPGAPFGNDLSIMESGKGYWIMMTSEDILETIGV